MGIDEDTAAVCRGDTIEVLGSSGILVIDVSAAKAAGNFTWSTADGLKAKGIILHYLEEGDRYNIATRTPLPLPERKPIEKGKEANVDYPLETNLFAPDAFRNMLVDGMAENQKDETSGIAFTLDNDGRGTGSQWTLRKTAQDRRLLRQHQGRGHLYRDLCFPGDPAGLPQGEKNPLNRQQKVRILHCGCSR